MKSSFQYLLSCSLLLTVFPVVLHSSPIEVSVHAFYYLWYGYGEKIHHWDHSVLEHWDPKIQAKYPLSNTIKYIPPEDIHAPFYPARGLYSSNDPLVIQSHLQNMQEYGINVAICSWWGRPDVTDGDSQGISTDEIIDVVLREALKLDMKIALHLEPYPGRNIPSIIKDMTYLTKYTTHPAYYHLDNEPVFYVYDSYHISVKEWQSFFITKPIGFFIGLWLTSNHGHELSNAGFDGAYTYFASEGFSYGSTLRHWKSMSKYCQEHDMLFIPSVGPGYDDSRIRPWNRHNTKPRNEGSYYKRMITHALECDASIVTITSYNEWGEGTQIEPAIPRDINVNLGPEHVLDAETREMLHITNKYQDYLPYDPDYYMRLTLEELVQPLKLKYQSKDEL